MHIIRSIDLNLLVVLAILLQTKSVTRAAQRLGLSQPSVSRSLGQLREILSDPLLVRSNSGMELTRRAEELAKPLEGWLAMTSQLLQPDDFDPKGLDRRFRVASTDFGVLSVISPALPLVARAAPGAVIEVSAFSSDMIRKLVSGELDLIVTGLTPDPSQTHMRYLFSETFSCVVRPGHRLVERRDAPFLPLDEYLAWPHIGIAIGDRDFDHVEFCLGARAVERNIIARTPYFYATPDLLDSGEVVLTMPSRAARKFARQHGFVCIPAPEEIAGFDYWALWHERSARDPATLWLIDLLATASADMPPLEPPADGTEPAIDG
ncbi:MAG: LysR family transcriptional regulator [Sphingobium sp.]